MYSGSLILAALVAQTVKNLPAMQKTQVQSLGGEGSLVKGMATHSSIFAWRIPWTEEPGGLHGVADLEKEMATHSSILAWRIPGMGEPGGLPSMGSHRVRHN